MVPMTNSWHILLYDYLIPKFWYTHSRPNFEALNYNFRMKMLYKAKDLINGITPIDDL